MGGNAFENLIFRLTIDDCRLHIVIVNLGANLMVHKREFKISGKQSDKQK